MQYSKMTLSFGMACCLCSIQLTHSSALNEVTTFFKGFVKNPKQVGALFPCSSFVGNEITKYCVRFNEHTKKDT